MIVLVVLKAPESSLDLQKSEMPLVSLKKIKKMQTFKVDINSRPFIPVFRRALSKVDLPTFGIPMTRTLSSMA